MSTKKSLTAIHARKNIVGKLDDIIEEGLQRDFDNDDDTYFKMLYKATLDIIKAAEDPLPPIRNMKLLTMQQTLYAILGQMQNGQIGPKQCSEAIKAFQDSLPTVDQIEMEDMIEKHGYRKDMNNLVIFNEYGQEMQNTEPSTMQ